MGFVGWIMPIMIILCLAWGALWGFKRKLYHTLLRFGTLVVAALASLLLAKLLGGLLGDYALSALTSLLGEGAAASLSDPNYAALAQALGQMIAAPILFFLCYLVLKPLSWLLFILIVSLFRIPKGPKLCGRLSGAVAGLLCGFLGLVVFVVPVSGYLTVVDNAAAQIWEADEMPAELAEITDIKNTPVAKQAYDWVGAAIFDSLTTAQMGEAEVSLQGEINAVLALVEDAKQLSEKPMEEYGEAEAQLMKKLAEDIGKSQTVSFAFSTLLSDASKAWLNGEEALGMAKPEVGPQVQGIVDAFLTVFSTSTPDNIDEDLGTFADVFGILIKHDLLASGEGEGEGDDLVTTLVSDGVVLELYQVLDANPRMEPVKAAIVDAGMRAILDGLDLPELEEGLMEDVADALKSVTNEDGTLNMEALNEEVSNLMAEYDVSVGEEITQLVSEGIADIFTAEELQTLTVPELVDVLTERFGAAKLPEAPPAAA